MYGIKKPYEDDRETHGLCPECFKWEMEKIESMKKEGISHEDI